ncbi:ClbS/DfsB family four-helix bundle protein [Mesorhizobium sp. ANAO-SY3R2]|uniref:ClbS/DfsB family four-helix bundle protein n=1 Tax=Mesorhizobium sp. ANAO-SY3R2 TaxID=3166644 RepID=UPI00366BB7F9
MAVPQSKSELLEAISVGYDRLARELATVPVEFAGEATLDGHVNGAVMSVRDLVSYLIGWNELVLKWHARAAAGEAIDFPETGFKWNELGRLARKFYGDYQPLSFPELLQRFGDAKARIVALVEGYTEAELYGRPWYRQYTMGRMIQFNTSSPYANARGRLRKWKKAKGGYLNSGAGGDYQSARLACCWNGSALLETDMGPPSLQATNRNMAGSVYKSAADRTCQIAAMRIGLSKHKRIIRQSARKGMQVFAQRADLSRGAGDWSWRARQAVFGCFLADCLSMGDSVRAVVVEVSHQCRPSPGLTLLPVP